MQTLSSTCREKNVYQSITSIVQCKCFQRDQLLQHLSEPKFKFKVLNEICKFAVTVLSLGLLLNHIYIQHEDSFFLIICLFQPNRRLFNIPCYPLTVCAFSQQLWFNVELFAPASVQKLPIQIKTSPNKSGGMCNCPHLFYAPGLFENLVFVLYI